MKILPAGMQDHLDTKTTTTCLCWKVVRTDGLVQGFTEHDNDLNFEGVTFLASTGFSATEASQSLGLAVDNLNVEGAMSSDSINENDLSNGLYDDAEVWLWRVNWKDTNQRVIVGRGNIGQVKRQETLFSAEFRSMSHRLNQKTGRLFQRSCDALIGDARCAVNLQSAAFHADGAVTQADGRHFTLGGAESFEAGLFDDGLFIITSGVASGSKFEVKTHSAGGKIELWQNPPIPIVSGANYTVKAGCDHSFKTCKSKFNNSANFRGFPYIPGSDTIVKYPNKEEQELDGGSLYKR